MSRKKVKNVFLKIFNIVIIIGTLSPLVYFLYHFIPTVIDWMEIKINFVPAFFAAWTELSGFFLKMAFISSIFIVIKLLTLIPSFFGRIKLYHKGTDVSEISLAEDVKDLNEITTDSFVALYKSIMYEPEKVAALLPSVLYAIASERDIAYEITCFALNRDGKDSEMQNEFENIKKQILGKKHVALSYYTCTSPEKGYEVTEKPVTRIKTPGDSSDEKDEKTLYIACSGSGSYRPIRLKALHIKSVMKSSNDLIRTLQPEDTIWVLDEFSSTLVNVKDK